MSKLFLAIALIAAAPCASALAKAGKAAGAVPTYCAGVQRLGDGSWSVKTDEVIGGVSYPAGTVLMPGAMHGGKDVAQQLTSTCTL